MLCLIIIRDKGDIYGGELLFKIRKKKSQENLTLNIT